jgi:hypothetical protein
MASGFTQFAINLWLEKLLRGTAGTWPATFYIGLSSTLPTDAPASNWNVTEPTGVGGYVRQPVTVGTAAFPALSLGATTNSNVINFGTASAPLGTMIDWVMFDAVTAGNLFAWADLVPSQLVGNGNPYSFAIGALGIAGI